MKTKLTFLFLLFIIFSLSTVQASVTSSQPQINFDLIPGEEVCEELSVSSDSKVVLKIEDIWAESYEGEGSNSFTYSDSDYGMEINYLDVVIFDEPGAVSFDVCATASQVGNYKGKLVFTLESASEEGTGAGFVFQPWIRVKVSEPPLQNNAQNNGDSGGGGNGGGGSQVVQVVDEPENDEAQDFEIEELATENTEELENFPEETEKKGVGESEQKVRAWNYIPLVIIAFIIVAAVYTRVKRKNQRKLLLSGSSK